MNKQIIEGDVEEFRRFADARCLLECRHGWINANDFYNKHTKECESRTALLSIIKELITENEIMAGTITALDKQNTELRKKKK